MGNRAQDDQTPDRQPRDRGVRSIPPTLEHGFWSFTMYGSDFRLVKNPINRFSIWDRTKGLTANPNGSLDVYIQSEPPAGHESNWLPSPPSGLFRIDYRMYPPAEGFGDAGQISSADQEGRLKSRALAREGACTQAQERK